MNCTSTRRLLSAYIDSELTPDDMGAIRNHLFGCDDCCKEYDELRSAKTDLSHLRAEEPGEELLRFIACKPWETGMAPVRTAPARGWFGTRRMITGFAAAAVFVVSVGIGLSTPGWNGIPESRDLAKSFKAEHTRLGYGSPLSGSPDAIGIAQVTPEEPEGDGVLNGSGDTVTASDGAFVTFVSHTTME